MKYWRFRIKPIPGLVCKQTYTQFIYSNRDVYIAIAALCSKLLHSAIAIDIFFSQKEVILVKSAHFLRSQYRQIPAKNCRFAGICIWSPEYRVSGIGIYQIGNTIPGVPSKEESLVKRGWCKVEGTCVTVHQMQCQYLLLYEMPIPDQRCRFPDANALVNCFS
jgi:hypothetical protein